MIDKYTLNTHNNGNFLDSIFDNIHLLAGKEKTTSTDKNV